MMLRKVVIGVLLVVAVGGGALWATGQLDLGAIANEARMAFGQGDTRGNEIDAERLRAPSVSVVEAAPRKFVEKLRVTGSLVARKEILIAPEIEGQRVASLLVEAGDRVEKGQVLARLARANLDAQVAQNRAQLARAQAAIAQAHGTIKQAQAQLTEADAALKRAEPLSRSGYMSQSMLDQRRAAATTARAALAITQDSLTAAESEKAAAEARQRELEWRLARTEIRAPQAGLVLQRNARVGGIASAQGTQMFQIAADGELEFLGDVPSDDLGRIAKGQTAQIMVGGVGEVHGEVRLIEPEVDARTRLGKVRIFIGADRRLHVGQFAASEIETRRGSGVGVPASAVMHDRNGAYVQAVVGDRVVTRRITLGLSSDGFVEVVAGVSAGDVIVAKAGTFLADGDRITPVRQNGQPSGRNNVQVRAG